MIDSQWRTCGILFSGGTKENISNWTSPSLWSQKSDTGLLLKLAMKNIWECHRKYLMIYDRCRLQSPVSKFKISQTDLHQWYLVYAKQVNILVLQNFMNTILILINTSEDKTTRKYKWKLPKVCTRISDELQVAFL